MQIVEHVIEELRRFNPQARIEEDVEIDGVSPATSCLIKIVGSQTLQDAIKALEEENDELEEEKNKIELDLEKVEELLEGGKADEALKYIKEKKK